MKSAKKTVRRIAMLLSAVAVASCGAGTIDVPVPDFATEAFGRCLANPESTFSLKKETVTLFARYDVRLAAFNASARSGPSRMLNSRQRLDPTDSILKLLFEKPLQHPLAQP